MEEFYNFVDKFINIVEGFYSFVGEFYSFVDKYLNLEDKFHNIVELLDNIKFDNATYCDPAPTACAAAVFTSYFCGVPSKMKMPSPRVPQ